MTECTVCTETETLYSYIDLLREQIIHLERHIEKQNKYSELLERLLERAEKRIEEDHRYIRKLEITSCLN